MERPPEHRLRSENLLRLSNAHGKPQSISINAISSVQFSLSVMSDSLRPHGLQHARPPCPSPTPGAHSNSCPSSRWHHPTISSSVVPFLSCLQSFPASGSIPMSQFFASGGQRTGVSATAFSHAIMTFINHGDLQVCSELCISLPCLILLPLSAQAALQGREGMTSQTAKLPITFASPSLSLLSFRISPDFPLLAVPLSLSPDPSHLEF